MEKSSKVEIIVSILFSLVIIFILVFVFVYVFNVPSKPQHVHFIDTNECCDIKSSWVEKGVAHITFYDNSKIKCSADNVIIYIDHPCDYCDWGH